MESQGIDTGMDEDDDLDTLQTKMTEMKLIQVKSW